MKRATFLTLSFLLPALLLWVSPLIPSAISPSHPAPDAVARPKILGISHVRIRVSDFCKGHDFYSQVLGQHPNCPPGGRSAAPVGGSMALWSGQFITLNVHSFYVPPRNPEDLLEEVGFSTDDAAALRKYLESRNIEVSEVSEPGNQRPSFVVHDPTGRRIQFIEGNPLPGGERPQVPPAQQRQIIHAGFIVNDRAAEDHFFKDILGFHLYWHGGMKDEQDDWVAMQVPDGTDWVEYMLNISTTADKHTRGVMNHIAIGVPGIQAAKAQLMKNGWKPGEEPQLGRDGKWQLNLYDPDETRVEFMEFTPTQKPCCADYTGPHPGPKQ